METYFSHQALAFLWSTAVGAGLGVVYDWFRIGRILRRRWWVTVFAEDLLFSLIAALATAFCLTLTNYGQVRWFLLAGEGLGFCIYFNTIGVLVVKQARLVARIFAAIRRGIRRIFALFIKKLQKIINFLKNPFLFPLKWFKMKIHYFHGRVKPSAKKRKRRKAKKGKKIKSGR